MVAKVSATPAISRVEFRVDGKLRWTDRRTPFVMNGDNGRLGHRVAVDRGPHADHHGDRQERLAAVEPPAPSGSGAPGGNHTGRIRQRGRPRHYRRRPARPRRPRRPPPRGSGSGWPPRTTSASSGTPPPEPPATASTSTASGSRTSGAPTYTFGGLSCGITYRIAVDSVASGGARSSRALLTATTANCPPASVFLSPSGNDGAQLLRGDALPDPRSRLPRRGGRARWCARRRQLPGGQITFDSSKAGAGRPREHGPGPRRLGVDR